ncbi:MAG: rod shape-determining protein MreC [Proteobacteria bacterium]|nr:rod shape-determining protein MreC [Pseudomonadota bacterium]
MQDFFRKNRLRISVVLTFVVLSFYLIAQIDNPRSDNWFSALVQNISYPFQTSFHFIEIRLRKAWTHYIWLVDARQENDRLWKTVKSLEEENAKSREIRIKYRRMLDILEFKKRDPNRKIFAEVIVEIKKPFSRQLIINKGTNDGIRPNFAVVVPEGIVGKIQSSTSIQSVVQLISDSHSQFPVLIQRTRTKAMLHGSQDGTLRIRYIPRRLELLEKDEIVASGLAGIFPKGFPVGKITSINKKKFELFQSIVLTPSADLDRIEEVAVVLKSAYNIHQPLFTEIKE